MSLTSYQAAPPRDFFSESKVMRLMCKLLFCFFRDGCFFTAEGGGFGSSDKMAFTIF